MLRYVSVLLFVVCCLLLFVAVCCSLWCAVMCSCLLVFVGGCRLLSVGDCGFGMCWSVLRDVRLLLIVLGCLLLCVECY